MSNSKKEQSFFAEISLGTTKDGFIAGAIVAGQNASAHQESVNPSQG